MEDEETKAKFDAAIAAAVSDKRADNNASLTMEEHEKKLQDVREATKTLKSSGTKKITKEYRMVRKYVLAVIMKVDNELYSLGNFFSFTYVYICCLLHLNLHKLCLGTTTGVLKNTRVPNLLHVQKL